ncbi:hypothetical protein JRO89_XS12G0008100 [Xanthoceras sorbifolium]|uniref:Uncharacterized protein n=1 Tax=Xanthoceras sorbifolium TaxID=99658 RepID=A0ABQ8HA89_9ROSI|nr:hypothetical protein JRO89_XS12G0008100 [Xanthoceras sorbifolium]
MLMENHKDEYQSSSSNSSDNKRPQLSASKSDGGGVESSRGNAQTSMQKRKAEAARALSRARSTNIKDIQRAAMEAAAEEAFDSFSSSSTTVSSSCVEESSRRAVFMDEEEVFNMPSILDGLAEALILTPPAMKKGFKWDDSEDTPVDLTLWGD